MTRFDDAFAPLAVARSSTSRSITAPALPSGPTGRSWLRWAILRSSCTPGRASSRCRPMRWWPSASTCPTNSWRWHVPATTAPRCTSQLRRGDPVDLRLSEADLQNTPAQPLCDPCSADPPSSLRQNCSGKHAAMLATCVVRGWPTSSYLDRTHPLQVAITAHLRDLGCAVHHLGVDGCGAPTHALALDDLARVFGALASGDAAVARAMRPTRRWSEVRSAMSRCGWARCPA